MRSSPLARLPISMISMPRPKAWCNTQAADRRAVPKTLSTASARCSPRKRTAPAAAAGQPAGAAARTGRGIGRQDPLCPLRSQRLLGAAHARSSRADGARRSAEGRVVDGGAVLARHRRSYDRDAQIEQADHVEALMRQKRAARRAPRHRSPGPRAAPRPARPC